jgi:hypothetical protein
MSTAIALQQHADVAHLLHIALQLLLLNGTISNTTNLVQIEVLKLSPCEAYTDRHHQRRPCYSSY